ncbi:MAG: response regulator, partial [Desulfobacula sp.]|nr:response regulator [Desulfobacula sp.]
TQKTEKNDLEGILLKPFSPSALFDLILQAFCLASSEFKGYTASDDKIVERLSTIQGARILVAEDNHINQILTREILEDVGFDVTITDDGQKAVNLVENQLFDAVLMDIQMPVMDGYQATKLIRKNYTLKQIPIIAMTAHAMHSDKVKSIEAGMVEHISKPIDPDKLFAALLTWIEPKEDADNLLQKESRLIDKHTDGMISFKNMKGIDIQKGLSRTLGKKKLYKKIMTQFYNEYADANEKINKAIGLKEEKAALSLIHTIKGLAGSIGAEDLAQAAMEFEEQVKTRKGLAIKSKSDRFSSALNTVIESIKTNVISTAGSETDSKGKIEGSPERLIELLKKLKPCVLNREPKPSEIIM